MRWHRTTASTFLISDVECGYGSAQWIDHSGWRTVDRKGWQESMEEHGVSKMDEKSAAEGKYKWGQHR